MGTFASKLLCCDNVLRRDNNSERDRQRKQTRRRFSIEPEEHVEPEVHDQRDLSSSQAVIVESPQPVQDTRTPQVMQPDAQVYVSAFAGALRRSTSINRSDDAQKWLESVESGEGPKQVSLETTEPKRSQEISHGTGSPVRDAITTYRKIKDSIQSKEVTLKQLHEWNTQLDQSQQILKNTGSDILETENFSQSEIKDVEEVSKQIENRRKEIARSIYNERYIDVVIPLEQADYQILRDLKIPDAEGKNFRCVMTMLKERGTEEYYIGHIRNRQDFTPEMLKPEHPIMKAHIRAKAFYINLYNLDNGVFIAVNNDNTEDKDSLGKAVLPNSDILLLNQPLSVAEELGHSSSKIPLTRMYRYDTTNDKTREAIDLVLGLKSLEVPGSRASKLCEQGTNDCQNLEDTPNSKGIVHGVQQYKWTLDFKRILQIKVVKEKVRGERMYHLVLDFASHSADREFPSEED